MPWRDVDCAGVARARVRLLSCCCPVSGLWTSLVALQSMGVSLTWRYMTGDGKRKSPYRTVGARTAARGTRYTGLAHHSSSILVSWAPRGSKVQPLCEPLLTEMCRSV